LLKGSACPILERRLIRRMQLKVAEALRPGLVVVEKLAAGKPFIGFQTGDLSLQNARTLARAEIDYVYLEMEHGPMDFAGLHQFTVGMIDKAGGSGPLPESLQR
jgi:hypothetical protein